MSNKGAALVISYSAPRDVWQVEQAQPIVEELLAPFAGKERVVLVALLNGCSRTQAAARTGVSLQTIRNWEKRRPAFREATSAAEGIGFTLFEAELFHRALAGPSDPGSMRALELVIRTRRPEYRNFRRPQGVVEPDQH